MVAVPTLRGWVAATTLAAGLGLGAAPAGADCLYAEFYVTREGESPVHVLGENDPCVTSTYWTWFLLVPGNATQPGLPAGSPNGYHLDVRVPLPL